MPGDGTAAPVAELPVSAPSGSSGPDASSGPSASSKPTGSSLVGPVVAASTADRPGILAQTVGANLGTPPTEGNSSSTAETLTAQATVEAGEGVATPSVEPSDIPALTDEGATPLQQIGAIADASGALSGPSAGADANRAFPQQDDRQAAASGTAEESQQTGIGPDTQNGTSGQPEAKKQPDTAVAISPNTAPATKSDSSSKTNSPESTGQSQKDVIQKERARLTEDEGIKIAGRTFKLEAGASDRKVRDIFADQIGNMIDTNTDPSLIEYAVQEAQLAGISVEQLRVDLDTNLTIEVTKYKPGQDGKPEAYKDREPSESQSKLIRALGLPETRPEKPSEIAESARDTAERRKRELLVEIIKGNLRKQPPQSIEGLISREELFAYGRPILGAAMIGSRNSRRARSVIQTVLEIGSADDIALVIANENELQGDDPAVRQRETVLGKIRSRIGRHPRFKAELKRLDEDGKRKLIAREQLAALLANKATLKAIKKEYNKLSPLAYILLQVLGTLIVVTASDLLLDQMNSVGQGQV